MSLYISRHDKHLVLCKNIHFIDVWTLFHLIVSKLKKSMLCHNVKISYITCLTFAKLVSKTQSANMVLGFYTLHLQQWNLELSMTPLDPSPPCQSSSNTGSSLYHHKTWTCISNIRYTSDIFSVYSLIFTVCIYFIDVFPTTEVL